MPRSKSDQDAAQRATPLTADEREASELLENPETKAFVDAYLSIKDPGRRACIEWFVYALREED